MTVYWPNGSLTIPRVSSEFGMRVNPVTHVYTLHAGIDLVGWVDNCSPVDGVVTFAGYNGGAGNEVRIRAEGKTIFHKGDVYRILHNARLYVSTGQRVTARQAVGRMGTTGNSTGVHCHFETRPGGGNAVNPRTYMAAANASPSGGGSSPLPTPTPTTMKKGKRMNGVIYTDDANDKNRSGAIINTESGFVSTFGWFPAAYADQIAVGFGLAKAAKVTRAQYDQILKDARALAARQ